MFILWFLTIIQLQLIEGEERSNARPPADGVSEVSRLSVNFTLMKIEKFGYIIGVIYK